MAVLVRVLMLVACVPLLFPTGFCVCKVSGSGGLSPLSSLNPVEARPDSPPIPRKVGCCSRCAQSDDSSERTSSSRLVNLPPPASPPPVEDHVPGCPASPGADSLKWVDPTSQVVAVLALPAVVMFPVIEPAATAPLSSTPSNRWPSSPPLYLSHCSLVI